MKNQLAKKIADFLGPDARSDLERYRFYDQQQGTQRSVLMTIFAHQGLQTMLLYRLARHLRSARPTFLTKIGLVFYPVASRINDVISGMHIAPDARIGPGLFIAHYGGVVIGPGATIGANCNIGNDVTIGGGSPVIGDRCMIAVGARVLGDITVGSDVAVGANTVVVRDVEDRAVVVGGQVRTVSHTGAFNLVTYPGCEADPDRIAALGVAPVSRPIE